MKKNKLVNKFLSKPTDLTWQELIKVLSILGYEEIQAGKTSGSVCKFKNTYNHIIIIHKPHPDNIVKKYVIEKIIKTLNMEKK